MQSLGNSHNNLQDVNAYTCDNFITIPKENPKLDLGSISINIDGSKIIKPALPERVEKIKTLQHFGLPAWQNVRYSKTLQSFVATPGFNQLRVNYELCNLSKSKDYLSGTESLMAALSNAVFESNELLRAGLQLVVDWTAKSPEELNAPALVQKKALLLAKGQPLIKILKISYRFYVVKELNALKLEEKD
ncbi:unnamed protein product [Parnassius apollo]|uniref:(apollo) hypothetical protein n=1 Tax=Parnassius apollo TaxID=110799 RepID=A0A8S3W6Z8_PARAO|nr:unnamed protein product [Parnassius apollo]